MSLIVGVAGFTGTGKTTAVRYLAPRLQARIVYLGQAVKDEVARRNLQPHPENERMVRLEMRSEDPGALPRKMLPELRSLLAADVPVILDAVMSTAEREVLLDEFGAGRLLIVGFTAPMDQRLQRLERRAGRTATRSDVFRRDATEKRMGILDVIREADRLVSNHRGMARFHDALHGLKLELLRRRRLRADSDHSDGA